MSRRGENIHRRKDGRWEARIKIAIPNTGSMKYVSVYAKTYTEVKQKRNMLLCSQNPSRSNKQEKTLSEVLQLWLENSSMRQKDATKLKYQFIVDQHIKPQIGALPISQIDEITINRFLFQKQQDGRLDREGGLSPSYIKCIATVINSALQFAVSQNYCNPVRVSLNTPTVPKKELQILDKELQLHLERQIEDNCSPTGLGILISLNAGLRIGEVCALTWDDVNLEKRIISVRHTVSRVPTSDKESESRSCLVIGKPKTASSTRDIPISSRLYLVLQKMKCQATSDFVISTKDTFVSPRTYEYRFHRLLENYEVPNINYHALRHTFATRCIEVGVDVKTLSEIMGHSNVGITLNTYVHSSMELKREQMEKLSALLES